MDVAFRVDTRGVKAGLDDFAKKQLPFATALALTSTAGYVGEAWQDEMRDVLDRPTPFTLGAVAIRPAHKTRLIATVFIRPVAAQYLEPFVEGGVHFLGKKRGLLTPKAVPLNAYGNLSRNKLAQLKARKNVHIGAVRLRSGQVVNGVWQRSTKATRKRLAKAGGDGGGTLKLLIRFSDPQRVTQRLDFAGRAEIAVRTHFVNELGKGLARALASAK